MSAVLDRHLHRDHPWHRLPWMLLGAVCVLSLLLWEFGHFLERPAYRPPEPPPIEAEIVEIPPPPPAPSPPLRKATPLPPKPAPRTPAQPLAQVPREQPQLEPAPPPSPSLLPEPAPPPSRPALPPPPPSEQNARPGGTENMGAHTLVRPLPQIPDDLREQAFSSVAVARFHIAGDGSFSVELVTPTPNPRLNRLVLEALKNWKWFPALREGKPVSDTQDVRISLEVH